MNLWMELGAAIGGVVSVVLTTWALRGFVRGVCDAFDKRAQEQDVKVAVVSSELQSTRHEVFLLGAELTALRFAVQCLVEGAPPSGDRRRQVPLD